MENVNIGCPSLGLPQLPGGFDGVEPMNRKDYEAIVVDLFHKCNEAFIQAPQRREARPGYFKLVLGDIADALASVVPMDHAARSGVRALPSDGAPSPAADGKEDVYVTPQPIVDFCQSEMQRTEARNARKIHWQTFGTKVDLTGMGRTRQNGKVYEIRIQKRTDPESATEFYCVVNGHTVMEGTFTGNAWMAKRMLESALQALVNKKARNKRMSRLAAKRRVGILTPEEELADTIARQKAEEAEND